MPRFVPETISASPPLPFLDPDAEGCAHLLVEHEEMFGAFAFRSETPAAIEPIHRTVECPMGAPQAWAASDPGRIVRQRRVGIGRASIQDGLRQRLNLVVVGPAGGRRERIVVDADPVAVAAF